MGFRESVGEWVWSPEKNGPPSPAGVTKRINGRPPAPLLRGTDARPPAAPRGAAAQHGLRRGRCLPPGLWCRGCRRPPSGGAFPSHVGGLLVVQSNEMNACVCVCVFSGQSMSVCVCVCVLRQSDVGKKQGFHIKRPATEDLQPPQWHGFKLPLFDRLRSSPLVELKSPEGLWRQSPASPTRTSGSSSSPSCAGRRTASPANNTNYLTRCCPLPFIAQIVSERCTKNARSHT